MSAINVPFSLRNTHAALAEKCAPGLRCELHRGLWPLRCDKNPGETSSLSVVNVSVARVLFLAMCWLVKPAKESNCAVFLILRLPRETCFDQRQRFWVSAQMLFLLSLTTFLPCVGAEREISDCMVLTATSM